MCRRRMGSKRDKLDKCRVGIRGGSWNNTVANGNLRVSDRNNAGWTNTTRNNNVGFRAVRTFLKSGGGSSVAVR